MGSILFKDCFNSKLWKKAQTNYEKFKALLLQNMSLKRVNPRIMMNFL